MIKGATVDCSDLERDPLVAFQRKYDEYTLDSLVNTRTNVILYFDIYLYILVLDRRWYKYLMPLCCFILPTLIPHWAWNETVWLAWHVNICRYCVNLNTSWLLNSAAHKWGLKPYDKYVKYSGKLILYVSAVC